MWTQKVKPQTLRYTLCIILCCNAHFLAAMVTSMKKSIGKTISMECLSSCPMCMLPSTPCRRERGTLMSPRKKMSLCNIANTISIKFRGIICCYFSLKTGLRSAFVFTTTYHYSYVTWELRIYYAPYCILHLLHQSTKVTAVVTRSLSWNSRGKHISTMLHLIAHLPCSPDFVPCKFGYFLLSSLSNEVFDSTTS